MRKILTVNKPLGMTPLEVVRKVKSSFLKLADQPISYAGRLDPMAEGLLLLLIGSENQNREQYLHLDKVYEFEMVFGFETDTYDVLGLPLGPKLAPKDLQRQMVSIIKKYTGEINQLYPPYSSKPVMGKPLFVWSREGKLSEINIPSEKRVVYSLDIINQYLIDGEQLQKRVIENISMVSGDFRQGLIINAWQQLQISNQSFTVMRLRAKVSSGTYIRSLLHAIGQDSGVGAVALSIRRTEIGRWTLADAMTI